MLLRFVIEKNYYMYFLVALYFLVDSFFYSQGSYIYSHIYSLYKVSVIFGHSDMFI